MDEQDDRRRPQPTVELPHWTEPPTGEIPEALARDRSDDAVATRDPSLDAPTWREGERDLDDAAFEPASLGDDDTRVGPSAEEGGDPLAAFSFDELDTVAAGTRMTPAPGLEAARAARMAREAADAGLATEASPSAPAGPSQEASPREEARPKRGRRRGRGARRGARTTLHRAETRQAEDTPGAGSPEAQEIGAPFVEEAERARRRRGGTGSNGRSGGEGPEGRDLVTAVSSGLALGIVTIILFKLGSTTALLLCSAVVALTSLELFGVLRRAGYRPATLVGLLGAVGLTVGAYLRGEDAYPLVVALVLVFSLLWYLFRVEQARPAVNVAVTLLGFAWVGVLGSFAGLLLDPRLFPNRDGVAFVFGAVIVTVAYDIAAYVTGGRWGRHPMAPSISPAKTWEGLAGGTVAALVVAAVVVSQIHPWNLNRAIALGVVVAVLAPLGDLCESLFKRDLGLKDMGSLVPGHGGLFDRVDSLLFVLPATYCLLRLLNVT